MKTQIEEFLDEYLEDNTFEDLLEYLDITPYEALECLFDSGLVDEEVIWTTQKSLEILP